MARNWKKEGFDELISLLRHFKRGCREIVKPVGDAEKNDKVIEGVAEISGGSWKMIGLTKTD